jgi:hypothetical protein
LFQSAEIVFLPEQPPDAAQDAEKLFRFAQANAEHYLPSFGEPARRR